MILRRRGGGGGGERVSVSMRVIPLECKHVYQTVTM